MSTASSAAEVAINNFLKLLKFRTISGEGPSGSYQACTEWLASTLREIGLEAKVFSLIDSKPIVLAKWQGEDRALPGILLNSHYDVVPVMKEFWSSDPFDAKVLDNGFIYGRGSQDMKIVCIQYIEAIRKLKREGFVPKRNIHLLYVPDEEIGGADGMEAFLQSEQFQAIQPIAFAFDEGLANPTEAFTVFYGERAPWWFYIKSQGPTGHGSRFIPDTATSKIVKICAKALAFREEQEKLLKSDIGCKHGDMKKRKLGDVTTINLTMLKSGVSVDGGKTYALNVIPNEAVAGFDVRISPSMDIKHFENLLNEWCSDEGVSWEFAPNTNPFRRHYATSLEKDNVWWNLFQESCEKMGIPIEPEVFPAATDSRFIRKIGIPAFGFSPMNNTEILLHEHNEMVHKDVFLKGIEVYVTLFKDMFSHQ